MFDYNNHTDPDNNLIAVITASNLDFDTDIMFDNDTFSMDNGNLLAQFSTMHQPEELRNVSFMKHDESLYANFPQSYVNRIHIDFLENFMKASVVIKAPSVEEEARLVEEITKMLKPPVVSVDADDRELKDAEQQPVANTFLDPEAPSITFAKSPAADAEFLNLVAPSSGVETPVEEDSEQHDMPAPDITTTPAVADVKTPVEEDSEQHDMPAPDITTTPAVADIKTPVEEDSEQHDMPAPDITAIPAVADEETPSEEDSEHDIQTPEIAALDSIAQPADPTDDAQDEEDDDQDADDFYLASLYDSLFW